MAFSATSAQSNIEWRWIMTDQIIRQSRLRVHSRNSDLWTVAAFSVIGILVMLNLMLSLPDLSILVAQYNQF